MPAAECQPGHEADELEWEEWDPSQTTFLQHMLAGSVAGLAEHTCMFPVDTLKTHIQCERCGSSNPVNTLRCACCAFFCEFFGVVCEAGMGSDGEWLWR